MTESTAPRPDDAAGTGATPVGPDLDVVERTFEPAPEGSPEISPDVIERRALVIGEALIDVVRRADGSVAEHPGGSPANVALGLCRLGRGVDLLTWFGQDTHGRALTDHLEASGVTIVPGSATAERTSVATADIDADGVASYVFDLSWHVPERWASPPVAPIVVHTGSIAAVLEPGGPDVARILAAHRDSATITYDPNLRPSLMPPAEVTRPVIEGLVALSDVVKVSDEDLAWLEPGSDPLHVARRWTTTGPAVVIVTMGGNGATAVTADGKQIDVVAPKVTVADTVGAGDSFMGGLIDGLWSADLLGGDRRQALRAGSDATWRTVLERCARIAAITVSRAGANPPTRAELDA
ncbi:carbohydrate kinase [Cellulomonas sp. KRMCY2]|uniref:carbohydrate kinase family protein n=1 Tax=Cellulomonas sp. KRMCY2 TaxID=1304865 RepID=UPI0004BB43FF|nr:carbohydrate kinase [Cellulomonas sp. KRMCY2]